MDIDKCYETLEVSKGASPDQVKQAYKDLVNIWHPDRVSNNPRLKKKAEDKLKEINSAYETLESHLLSQQRQEPKSNVKQRYPSATEEERSRYQDKSKYRDFQSESEAGDESEFVVRYDQNPVSNLWSSITSAFRQMVSVRQSWMDRDDMDEWRGPRGVGMGRGRGRCMGGGKGMGRGRGYGKGRGGMGMGRGR